ncbi:hypothetical protein ABZ464_02715 [Streptomyces sp. NPDC005820]|uniref:hypothetical protein n=1 Tax=Streptomyces sp. NPDC005820 TaxID=3157069 RepID=UPI0034055D35
MKVDPVDLVWQYLNTAPYIPEDAPTGDLVGREVGDTTIYLSHSGGFRIVRDRMDRADIEYDVFHQERAQAASLAYTCRELFLEDLPGQIIGDVEILDVVEISSPRYYPDSTSGEHVYGGEITVFFTEN